MLGGLHVQVNVILLCTLLQCIPCAIQVTSLYYMVFNRDHFYMPLIVLPQFLEALLLNIPGLLPRLAQPTAKQPKRMDPLHPQEEAQGKTLGSLVG